MNVGKRLPSYSGSAALLAIAYDLFQGKTITSRYMREQYGVKRATAFRYLLLLETSIPGVVATGGERRGDPIVLRMRRAPSLIPLLGAAAA